MTVEAVVARRLRAAIPDIATIPTVERHREIKMALMDAASVDPDDATIISRVDDMLTRVLPRVKYLTGLSDDELASVTGRARPTIQAYVSGRLREHLDAQAYDRLISIVRAKQADAAFLLRDLQVAKQKAMA